MKSGKKPRPSLREIRILSPSIFLGYALTLINERCKKNFPEEIKQKWVITWKRSATFPQNEWTRGVYSRDHLNFFSFDVHLSEFSNVMSKTKYKGWSIDYESNHPGVKILLSSNLWIICSQLEIWNKLFLFLI